MPDPCPMCGKQLVDGRRFCHKCGVPLESVRPGSRQRALVMSGRLLILLTLVVNIIGWLGCFEDIDVAVMVGLLNGILGLVLAIVGAVGRYRWACVLGLAHLTLPVAMFLMIVAYRMGPITARPAFLWADAVFLAAVAPLSIIGCCQRPAIRESRSSCLWEVCGCLPYGLMEPRYPARRTRFDQRKLEPVPGDERQVSSPPERADQGWPEMPRLCPTCRTELADASSFCHACGFPLTGEVPAMLSRAKPARTARVLLVSSWLTCFVGALLIPTVDIESIILTGPILSVLGSATLVAGLVAERRRTSLVGSGHICLCLFMFLLIAGMGWSQRQAYYPALAIASAYVLLAAPLTIWALAEPAGYTNPWVCVRCGYLLRGLTEPRCPECGAPFDPKLLAGSNPRDAM